ncbi:hypothetical protein [Streptomyces sp. NPDC093111]|uniref:hypothetical protein n=1 Tax=Streptomyces sp. NPDC093111 TaxID=3154978 RepID=UPI00343CD55B
MSTEPQRPASRITDALLPPDRPTPPPPVTPTPPATTAPPATPAPAAPRLPAPAAAPASSPRPSAPAMPPADAQRPPAPAATPRSAAPASSPRPPVPAATPRSAAPAPRASTPAVPPEPAPRPPVATPRTPPNTPTTPPAPPRPPAAPAQPLPAVETTTRLRPIRDTEPVPAPAHRPIRDAEPVPAPAHRPVVTPHPYGVDRWALPDEVPAETTTRLRPVQDRRPGRVLAAAGCAVLGLGLIGGAAAGALLAESGAGEPAEPPGYARAKGIWHDAPVDALFPRTLSGPSAGPGGAARTWTRIVVAPDTPCTAAVLPKGLLTALKVPGCERVLRATYTDATSSHVTTVALVFTQADPATLRTLGSRAEDDPPPALGAPATVAAGFGDRQRASWWRHILTDLPVVVTSVSGFADGRAVTEAEPATRAMTPKRTTAVAQAGLGHEAKGVGDGVERALRTAVAATLKEGAR